MYEDLLFVLGGHQQSEGAAYTEGLVDHGLHFRKGPQKDQVLINGVDLSPLLQACHLDKIKKHENKGNTKNPTDKQSKTQ
jgi:hypothetical protein